MKWTVHRRRQVTLSAILFALTVGCGSWALDLVLQHAVDDIAGRLRPASTALRHELVPRGNPRGEGILVMLKAQSDCRSRSIWVWRNREQRFAIDSESQVHTPGVPVLATAAPEALRAMGLPLRHADDALRESLCAEPEPPR